MLASLLSSMDMVHYWSYPGSLTTPPCTEGIKWTVLSDVQNISDAQLEGIDKWFAANPAFAEGKGNNRVTMPLNDRTVYYAVREDDGATALTATLLALSAMLLF